MLMLLIFKLNNPLIDLLLFCRRLAIDEIYVAFQRCGKSCSVASIWLRVPDRFHHNGILRVLHQTHMSRCASIITRMRFMPPLLPCSKFARSTSCLEACGSAAGQAHEYCPVASLDPEIYTWMIMPPLQAHAHHKGMPRQDGVSLQRPGATQSCGRMLLFIKALSLACGLTLAESVCVLGRE